MTPFPLVVFRFFLSPASSIASADILRKKRIITTNSLTKTTCTILLPDKKRQASYPKKAYACSRDF